MELTEREVLAASDAWVWLPDGAVRFEVGPVEAIDYPDWARMGLYVVPRGELGGADVGALVADVRRAAHARGRDASSWWIGPRAEAAGFAQRLLDEGAVVTEEAAILALGLDDGGPDVGAVDPDVETVLVEDAASLEDAEVVTAAVWGGSPSSGDRRRQQLEQLADGLDVERGFRVVGRLSGRAVAAGGCQVVDGTARLYGACCLPDARGRGAYRAVLAARIGVALRHGARLALVHARDGTSRPILERIGFASFGHGRLLELPTS